MHRTQLRAARMAVVLACGGLAAFGSDALAWGARSPAQHDLPTPTVTIEPLAPNPTPREPGHAPPGKLDFGELQDSETSAQPVDASDAGARDHAGDHNLRRLKGSELTPDLVSTAVRLIRKHYRRPAGTELPFESAGQRYVARVERHFHPVGGPARPWGEHPGISLFAVR